MKVELIKTIYTGGIERKNYVGVVAIENKPWDLNEKEMLLVIRLEDKTEISFLKKFLVSLTVTN